ncbi:K(+)/H(+) antiporter, partial [Irineochytrium annulatum]
VGLELDPHRFLRNFRRSVVVSVAGITVPFVASIGAATVLFNDFADPGTSYTVFFVFVAAVMSLTHFPAIARILTERKLLNHPLGQATMAAASVDDVIAWGFLLFVIALVNNTAHQIVALWIFLVMIAYAAFLWFLVRPVLARWVEHAHGADNAAQGILVFGVLAMVLISAFFTQALGAHAMFGGFLVGVIVPHGHSFAIHLVENLEDMINIVFLPIFFVDVGLSARVDLMNDGESWGLVVLLVVIGSFGKILGVFLASRLYKSKLSWMESAGMGFLMNTKGLLEFVILNIGVKAEVINAKVFTILIIAVLFSNVLSIPLLSFILPKSLKKSSQPTTNGAETDDDKGAIALSKLSDSFNPRPLRLLCYLPGMPAVPSMMALTEMLNHPGAMMKVVALRLIRLSDRISTVMMATDTDATLRADPVMSIYRTFGHLNRIPVASVLAVANIEEFPDQIASAADDHESNLVVIPWQHSAEMSSLVDEAHIHSLVDAVQREARCSVAVFIDRGFGVLRELNRKRGNSSSNPSESKRLAVTNADNNSSTDEAEDDDDDESTRPGEATQRIFVPFLGSADDREALHVAAHMAKGCRSGVRLFVLHLIPVGLDATAVEADRAYLAAAGKALQGAVRGGTVDFEECETGAPVQSVMTKCKEAAGEPGDAVVMGAGFYGNTAMKLWVDRECGASVITVQWHKERSISK